MKPLPSVLKSPAVVGALVCIGALLLVRGGRRTLVPAPSTPRIVFTDRREIWIMDLQGHGQTNLSKIRNNPVHSEVNVTTSQPVLSPDRRLIAYTVLDGHSTDIFVMNVDGTQQKNVTKTSKQSESWPRWSSDGSKIVFYSQPTRVYDASAIEMVMNASGAGRRTISEAERHQLLNTNGKVILTTSMEEIWTGKPKQFYVANSDGSAKSLLPLHVSNEISINDVELSPDGKKVIFSMGFGRDSPEIYIMNIDGSGRKQLTRNTVYDHSPVFTPDGKKIVFVSVADSKPMVPISYIYIMNADGTQQTRLTNNLCRNGEPDVR